MKITQRVDVELVHIPNIKHILITSLSGSVEPLPGKSPCQSIPNGAVLSELHLLLASPHQTRLHPKLACSIASLGEANPSLSILMNNLASIVPKWQS
jgi:hypothetical protein